MRINHNSQALNATNHFAKINNNIAKSMERLSSGYKITSPADDAAGLAISTKMNAQIRGLKRASLNSNDGISVIQSAEGGLEEMHAILGRMRELAVQAANDAYQEEDRDAIQEEINSLEAELNQIAQTTAFNDQKLLNGDMSRRSISSDSNVRATYISQSVPVGVYSLDITKDAQRATLSTGVSSGGGTVTKEQEGSITVNGFSVEISEGMSMTDVYEALQTHLAKIHVDVYASADGGATPADFSSGAPVYFRTQEYGSKQKLEIGVSNPELEALLGITDGDVVRGEDCVANINVTDEGFSSTASFTTDGNEIRVVDRNGFEMLFEATPEAVAQGGAISTEVEVLSAGPMVIQTGANSGEQISLDIPMLTAKGLDVEGLIMYTHEYASEAVTLLDKAIEKISNARSKLGAYENRLEDIYDNLEIQGESVTEAYSRIMDTDMATEMTEYTQQDVLAQAAIAMMQKANERPESLLQLLQ